MLAARSSQRETLHLLSRRPSELRLTPLSLWHVLSLDAPSVAALWTVFVARSYHVALPWQVPAAMFAAVWMIYAADRLLDAHLAADHDALALRHRFHHRFRSVFLSAFAVTAVALLWLLMRLPVAVFRPLAAEATLLIAWMLAVHVRPRDRDWQRMPKELGVGVFFAVAVWTPPLAMTGFAPEALVSAALFAATCTLNCLCLYTWELREKNLLHASRLHASTRWGTSHLSACAAGVVGFGMLEAVILHRYRVPAACALSAVLLAGLHRIRHRMSAVSLRASADLAMLTPLLVMALRTVRL